MNDAARERLMREIIAAVQRMDADALQKTAAFVAGIEAAGRKDMAWRDESDRKKKN